MFADSLVESAGRIHTRTRWTTLFSLCMQTLALGIAVLIPILSPHSVNMAAFTRSILPPLNLEHRQPPPRPRAEQRTDQRPAAAPDERVVEMPTEVPRQILPDNATRNDVAPTPVCVNCSREPKGDTGVDHGTNGDRGTPGPAVEPAKSTTPLRISMVDPGQLLNRVQPIYPAICRQIHCQGAVVLQAVIGRDGTITDLHVVSSAHALLTKAALDAVRQWRYKPYMLNGEKVEVETQITVNFTLGN